MARLSRLLEVVVARSTRVGVPLLMNRVFSDPIKRINQEYIEKIGDISHRMQEEHRGKPVLTSSEKFRAVLDHLDKFEDTEDVAHLEKAKEVSQQVGCEVCQRFIDAALRATKEGKMGEAHARITGFKRGVQAVLP